MSLIICLDHVHVCVGPKQNSFTGKIDWLKCTFHWCVCVGLVTHKAVSFICKFNVQGLRVCVCLCVCVSMCMCVYVFGRLYLSLSLSLSFNLCVCVCV